MTMPPSFPAAAALPADTLQTSPANGDGKENEEEEEDYMSMAIPDPTSTTGPQQPETYTQRRQRKAREAEAKQPRSKAALRAEETAARDAALATSLPADSKGAKMMARLGYKPGRALGAEGNKNARVEPLGVEVKEGREGVGMGSERKRKFREEVEGVEKRVKAEETGYRERVAREREEKRAEGMWWGGMKVLEGLEGLEEEEEGGEDGDEGETPTGAELRQREKANTKKRKKRKKDVNLLYRPLIKEREDADRERKARYNLLQSLSRDRNYEDPDEDEQDQLAFGEEEEADGLEEDSELEEYLTLDPQSRLAKVVAELREKFRYCFWCKARYESEAMEGCPGLEEDEHD